LQADGKPKADRRGFTATGSTPVLFPTSTAGEMLVIDAIP